MHSEEPPEKKPKTEDLEELTKFRIVDDYVTQIQQSQKNLNAVLSDDLYNPIPMINVYVGTIKHPTMISKAIQVLNEKLPLEGLSHLKRVRSNCIILGPVEILVLNNMSIQEYVEYVVPELNDVFDYFKEMPVPAVPPKLRKQYLDIRRKWSCNFHPDSYLENLAGDKFFKPQELESHRNYMSLAFEVALYYFKSNNIDISKDVFQRINVTAVVDPAIQSVVAIGLTNINHPVQHSTMVAIDNVAKTQTGGVWNLEDKEDSRFAGINKELLVYLKKSVKKHLSRISYGAKMFVSKKEYEDRNEKFNSSECGPYLCTNYYVYSLREPCLMCAMALVHARAKRVFFCFDNPEFGALKSKTKLHTVSALNHRYEVFTGFL